MAVLGILLLLWLLLLNDLLSVKLLDIESTSAQVQAGKKMSPYLVLVLLRCRRLLVAAVSGLLGSMALGIAVEVLLRLRSAEEHVRSVTRQATRDQGEL